LASNFAQSAMPTGQLDAHLTNGHNGHAHPPASAKKTKGKKNMPNDEASRLLHARISQLEQDAAGEKDQELEIGASDLVVYLRRSPSEQGTIYADTWTLQNVKSRGQIEIFFSRSLRWTTCRKSIT
jgi:hypothetical protein